MGQVIVEMMVVVHTPSRRPARMTTPPCLFRHILTDNPAIESKSSISPSGLCLGYANSAGCNQEWHVSHSDHLTNHDHGVAVALPEPVRWRTKAAPRSIPEPLAPKDQPRQ